MTQSTKSTPGEGLTSAYPHRDVAVAALMIGRLTGDGGADGQATRSALRWLNRGIDRLRTAETGHLQPVGFIARARALVKQRGPMDDACSDLERAFEIAVRGTMRLCMAEIHLCRAELFRSATKYPWNRPEDDLAAAEKLIEECGYWRRREQLRAAREGIVAI